MIEIIKTTLVSILALSLTLTNLPIENKDMGPGKIEEEIVEMVGLNRFNTQEAVLLRDKPIYIPKELKRKDVEFRGAWVSTVYNIDFPSKSQLPQEEYKKEYINLLDNVKDLNLNAIIFQVRPKSDAFYRSNINPWSEYLTGKQGQAPDWDPLPWMIDEAHRRGIEFHAWFNPYRVTTGSEKLDQLAPNNWARNHPDYVLEIGGKLYLNPGEPEVINYIHSSVMEVVENYAIDGVHFDDYFYPNKSTKDKDIFYTDKEKTSYEKYGGSFKDLSDWRRDNVDRLIYSLHKSIKDHNQKYNKSVDFGISPFAIWGNIVDHPEGSPEGVGSNTSTGSPATYDNYFADTRKWVKNGWLDYIAPQIYWTFTNKSAPYAELASWWADVVKGTNVKLYIGHGSYRKADINNKEVDWTNSDELINQLKFNSLYKEIQGSIFFSYKSLLEKENGPLANNDFIKKLKNHYNEPALVPGKK